MIDNLKLSAYDYNLPEELIAQYPSEKRDHSRLMVLNRETGLIENKFFYEIVEYLRKDDILVINNSKVIPARFYGKKKTGGRVEFLLSKKIEEGCKKDNYGNLYDKWEAIIYPARKIKQGMILNIKEKLYIEVDQFLGDGRFIIYLPSLNGNFYSILEEIGTPPLPPYVKRYKHPDRMDKIRYQTIYAKNPGSVAAPTAGFHFTEELISKIKSIGVSIVPITLHVGIGTFQPVRNEDITLHKIHSEYFEIDKEVANILEEGKKNRKRIIAVGTTSVRVLESAFDEDGKNIKLSGECSLFIYPGYKFKMVNGMITNFHLPKTTLLMLVSALAGRETILKAYQKAIELRYRFYSFGDAMLIL